MARRTSNENDPHISQETAASPMGSRTRDTPEAPHTQEAEFPNLTLAVLIRGIAQSDVDPIIFNLVAIHLKPEAPQAIIQQYHQLVAALSQGDQIIIPEAFESLAAHLFIAAHRLAEIVKYLDELPLDENTPNVMLTDFLTEEIEGDFSFGGTNDWENDDLFGDIDVTDATAIYFQTIKQFSLLNKDQEQALFGQILAGRAAAAEFKKLGTAITSEAQKELQDIIDQGKSAHELFTNSNLRLVVSIAKRYLSSGVPFLDLIQEGNLGLLKAMEKYDVSRGFKFSTYGTYWIIREIQLAVAKTSRVIRLPEYLCKLLRKYDTAYYSYAQDFGHFPNPREMSNYLLGLGWSEAHIISVTATSHLPVQSLDQPRYGDVGNGESSDTLGDFTADQTLSTETQFDRKQVWEKLMLLINSDYLSEKQREMLIYCFALSETSPIKGSPDSNVITIKEISKFLGISAPGGFQRLQQVLGKLRERSEVKDLRSVYEDWASS